MEMKYIIVEDTATGKRIPIIFGKELTHKAVYLGVRYGMRNLRDDHRSVTLVSAGFTDGVAVSKVYGESESLRYGPSYIPEDQHDLTKSHPEDKLIINGE